MSLTQRDESVPIVMARTTLPPEEKTGRRGSLGRKRGSAGGFQSVPYLVLVISLLLTLLATVYAEQSTRAKERLRFENLVQQTDDAIRARLENYISLLRGVSGLLASDPFITREEFDRYVGRLNIAQNYPGIQGLGVAVHLRKENRALLISRARQQGILDYHIFPEKPPREDYYAILYLSPMDRRNRAAVGFDMGSEENRLQAMLRARDEGKPIATGRVILVQEIDEIKQPGFLVYVPVYRERVIPATVEARRRSLWAFAYAPFRAGDLFDGIFGTQTAPRIGFSLYSGAHADEPYLLHRSVPGRRAGHYAPSQASTSRLEVAGQTWTVVHETTPDFERTGSGWSSFILLAGFVTSGVLFTISRGQAEARRSAEEYARHLNASRRALEENEARQRHFLRDVLLGVTEGKLRLCHDASDLPARLPAVHGPMQLRRETLRELREAAREVALTQGLPAERWQDLLTAVGEAAMNAVVHGNGGQAQVGAGIGATVQVWITDQGAGIDMHSLPRATLERGFTTADSLGHGFWLILRTVDRVWLLTGSEGTTVVLEQDPVAADPSWLSRNG